MKNIASWVSSYKDKKTRKFLAEFELNSYESILSQLREKGLNEEAYLYQNYNELHNLFMKDRKKIEEFVAYEKQCKTASVRYFYFRPYKIIFNPVNRNYYLEHYGTVFIRMKTVFWRVYLIMCRLVLHSRNLMIKSLKLCFFHQFGVKGLFYCK